MMLLFSIALFFASTGFAQGQPPDFYYLENLESETISVRACQEAGADCAVVAELTRPELMAFLLSQRGMKVGEKNYYKMSVTSILAGTSIIFVGEGFQLAWASRLPAGVFIALGAAFGLAEIFQERGGAKSDLADHVRSGIIGGSSEANREILERFTDFLNNRASAGTDFAPETVLPQ